MIRRTLVLLLALACRPAEKPVEMRGWTVGSPMAKPNIVLTSTDGKAFDLRARTAGQVTLVFFGYTTCPDVCPVHMANVAGALKRIDAKDRGRVRVVFVTTDPARDSLPKLRGWLDNFDRSFIGLSGTDEQILQAERAFGLPPAIKEKTEDGSLGGYGIGHAAQIVAFTPDDTARFAYPAGVTQDDWVHDLPLLVNHKWSQ